MAGYSGTPLTKKLGIKPGSRVYVAGAPPSYFDTWEPLPDDVQILRRPGKNLDVIQYFTKRFVALRRDLPKLMKRIQPAGAIWVSWPKKASKVPTDVTEDRVRDLALTMKLVDVKVCAVDEVWSGLKLVIRKEHRPR